MDACRIQAQSWRSGQPASTALRCRQAGPGVQRGLFSDMSSIIQLSQSASEDDVGCLAGWAKIEGTVVFRSETGAVKA